MFVLNDKRHLVTLDKETSEIYVDGCHVESEGEFCDEGSRTYFQLTAGDSSQSGFILTSQSVSRPGKIDHRLFIDDVEMQEDLNERF